MNLEEKEHMEGMPQPAQKDDRDAGGCECSQHSQYSQYSWSERSWKA